MADDLASVVAEAGLPLDVREVNWSHGACHIFTDLLGGKNHRSTGEGFC